MHPHQDQIDKMWNLIKRRILAQKNGFWIESLCLGYTLLEIELRLLLSSKARARGVPIPPRKIDSQEYLINLAKDNGFIDRSIWERIKDFNDVRKKAIHKLAQGEISYEDLKESTLGISNLIRDVQSCWLPIKIGPDETRPHD